MKTCDHCLEITAGKRAVCPVCGRHLVHHAPTKAEIAVACAAIQKTWTPGLRATRTSDAYRRVHADTPRVGRITDHMRRRDGEGGQDD